MRAQYKINYNRGNFKVLSSYTPNIDKTSFLKAWNKKPITRVGVNSKNSWNGIVSIIKDLNERLHFEENERKKLAKIAITDYLTGLHNRRVFFEALDKINESNVLSESISVIMIDIDNFKNINDNFGHFGGDLVIKQVGDIIKTSLTTNDIVTRIGGEEFGIILYNTPEHHAYVIAENIRKRVYKYNFIIDELKNTHRCTISVGIANSLELSGENKDNLYKVADERLYIAKFNKNQVCVG